MENIERRRSGGSGIESLIMALSVILNVRRMASPSCDIPTNVTAESPVSSWLLKGELMTETRKPLEGDLMKARIDFAKVLMPKAMQALYPMAKYINSSGLDHRLLELVKMRTSQLNGCAYCIDMHSKDARAAGETEQRLYALSAWSEAPFFTERERAALALTEAVTRIEGGVADDVLDRARASFTPAELSQLVFAIVT